MWGLKVKIQKKMCSDRGDPRNQFFFKPALNYKPERSANSVVRRASNDGERFFTYEKCEPTIWLWPRGMERNWYGTMRSGVKEGEETTVAERGRPRVKTYWRKGMECGGESMWKRTEGFVMELWLRNRKAKQGRTTVLDVPGRSWLGRMEWDEETERDSVRANLSGSDKGDLKNGQRFATHSVQWIGWEKRSTTKEQTNG